MASVKFIKLFVVWRFLWAVTEATQTKCHGSQGQEAGCTSGVLTVTIPAAVSHENLVICANSRTEVAAWSPPNQTSPGPQYQGRAHISVTGARNDMTVRIEIFNSTKEDSRLSYECHSSSCVGNTVNCTVSYRNQEVSSLRQSCSYSSADRTVRCDRVTSEVRIYRSGEHSDRDIRYFSGPFLFPLGRREAGTYRVAVVEASGEEDLDSDVFEFHVDKSRQEADDKFDLHLVLVLVIPLAMFLVLPLAGLDIILPICREQRQPQKQTPSEDVPLTSMSSDLRDQGQECPGRNGQQNHVVPSHPGPEDSHAKV